MTTPVHADPRRSGAAAGLGISEAPGNSSGLEMPVLFQLSDLTQQRVLSPPQKSKPSGPASETVAAAKVEPDAAKPATESAILPVAGLPAEATNGDLTPSAGQPLLTAAVSATEIPASPADSPTIRERAKLRERRRQAASQGDWFQTQGKYILVVFLVLLVGVIYVARRGGDDSPPSPTLDIDLAAESSETQSPVEVPSNDVQLADTSEPAPPENEPGSLDENASPSYAEHASGPEMPANEMVAHPGEESPAMDSAPQVTLQAPVQNEPIEHPAADGGLFPWAQQPEPRVATRPPEPPGSSPLMPQANPHFQARPQAGTPGVPPVPANSPPEVYPSTGYEGAPIPQGALPADAEAPAVYPVVDPPLGPALPRSSSTQPPRSANGGGVMPASYENRVSTDTRTSGSRHERTGSGLY